MEPTQDTVKAMPEPTNTPQPKTTWDTPTLRIMEMQETSLGYTGGSVENDTYSPLAS